MGLPVTFFGLLGFIILSGYLISDIMDNNASSSEAMDAITNMQMSLNNTLDSSESSGGFSGFFNMLGSIILFGWSLVVLALSAIASFVTIPLQRGLPVEMYVVFSLIVVSFFAATVKWIWSGE